MKRSMTEILEYHLHLGWTILCFCSLGIHYQLVHDTNHHCINRSNDFYFSHRKWFVWSISSLHPVVGNNLDSICIRDLMHECFFKFSSYLMLVLRDSGLLLTLLKLDLIVQWFLIICTFQLHTSTLMLKSGRFYFITLIRSPVTDYYNIIIMIFSI